MIQSRDHCIPSLPAALQRCHGAQHTCSTHSLPCSLTGVPRGREGDLPFPGSVSLLEGVGQVGTGLICMQLLAQLLQDALTPCSCSPGCPAFWGPSWGPFWGPFWGLLSISSSTWEGQPWGFLAVPSSSSSLGISLLVPVAGRGLHPQGLQLGTPCTPLECGSACCGVRGTLLHDAAAGTEAPGEALSLHSVSRSSFALALLLLPGLSSSAPSCASGCCWGGRS